MLSDVTDDRDELSIRIHRFREVDSGVLVGDLGESDVRIHRPLFTAVNPSRHRKSTLVPVGVLGVPGLGVDVFISRVGGVSSGWVEKVTLEVTTVMI